MDVLLYAHSTHLPLVDSDATRRYTLTLYIEILHIVVPKMEADCVLSGDDYMSKFVCDWLECVIICQLHCCLGFDDNFNNSCSWFNPYSTS